MSGYFVAYLRDRSGSVVITFCRPYCSRVVRSSVLALAALVVASCGPPSPEAAAAQCAQQARAASGPVGGVAIGLGSGGRVSSRVDVAFSGDYLARRDPQEVYQTCLARALGPGSETTFP